MRAVTPNNASARPHSQSSRTPTSRGPWQPFPNESPHDGGERQRSETFLRMGEPRQRPPAKPLHQCALDGGGHMRFEADRDAHDEVVFVLSNPLAL